MQDFLDKAIELEALKFGSFKLKSGMESDYFFNIAAFFDSESLSFLADCYVSKILDLKILELKLKMIKYLLMISTKPM